MEQDTHWLAQGIMATFVTLFYGITLYNIAKEKKAIRLEDKTAIASSNFIDDKSGNSLEGYLAFDISGNGEIDVIKEYSQKEIMAGFHSCHATMCKLYRRDNPEFEKLKQKYFKDFK